MKIQKIINILNKCELSNITYNNYLETFIKYIPKDLINKYHLSRSKLIIELNDIDYIIKIFLKNIGSIENLLLLNNNIKKQKLNNCFLEYKLLLPYNNIFIQRKANNAEKQFLTDTTNYCLIEKLLDDTLFQHSYYLNNATIKNNQEYYKWLNDYIQIHGYKQSKILLNFISKNGIIDVFSRSNIGYVRNKPVIFDYDNCFRYDLIK